MTSSVPTISPAGRRLPRTWEAAKAAWIDLYRIFRNLPRVWVVALAIKLGLSAPALLMDVNVMSFGAVLVVGIDVASAFLLTPYAIAAYRLIILDEIAQSYVLRPREERFQKFFGWWLILSACQVGVFWPVLAGPVLLPLISAITPFILIPVSIASLYISCWVTLRLSIAFPAIAVDAAGANWRNVMADTKGYAWQIFLIVLLASLPFTLVELALWAAGRPRTILMAVTERVISIVSITLLVVIASRLYERLGNRVNQPAMA